jgi:hypothetical protein
LAPRWKKFFQKKQQQNQMKKQYPNKFKSKLNRIFFLKNHSLKSLSFQLKATNKFIASKKTNSIKSISEILLEI